MVRSKKEKTPKKINGTTKKKSVKRAVGKGVAKKTARKTSLPSRPRGFPEELLDVALKVLDERKAEEIITVPLVGRSSIADYMIIASGRAGRQVVALADHLREAFYKRGVRSVRVEGQADANWVLVDAGDLIVHLFLPEVRRYYDLDSLWSKKAAKK